MADNSNNKIVDFGGLSTYHDKLKEFLQNNYVAQKNGASNALLCRVNGVVTSSSIDITTANSATTLRLTTAQDINIGNNLIPSGDKSLGSSVSSWTAYLKDTTVNGKATINNATITKATVNEATITTGDVNTATIETAKISNATITSADIKTFSQDTGTLLQGVLNINSMTRIPSIEVATDIEDGSTFPTTGFTTFECTPATVHIGDTYIATYQLIPSSASAEGKYTWWKINFVGYILRGLSTQVIGKSSAINKVANVGVKSYAYIAIPAQATDEELMVTLTLVPTPPR